MLHVDLSERDDRVCPTVGQARAPVAANGGKSADARTAGTATTCGDNLHRITIAHHDRASRLTANMQSGIAIP
jgi:hypothetical protein